MSAWRRGPFLIVTAAAVVVMVAGLLVWHPWNRPPTAPSAVVATSRTATSVVVSWSASRGGDTPDRYLIMRNGAQVGSVLASQTSFTDHGLTPGARYHYTVIAAAGAQRSLASVKADVTTLTPSPVGFGVTAATYTTVDIRWSPSPLGPSPGQYEIFDGTTSIGSVPGTAGAFNITGLTPGTTYVFAVIARWGNAASSRSATVPASTLEYPLNGAETVNVKTTATPGAGASLSVGEHWSDTWQFTANCTISTCKLTTGASLAAPGFATSSFTIILTGSGGKYAGSARARISMCSTVKVTNTVTLSISARDAVTNGAWNAWTGTMRVSSPYTTVGSEFCPAQSWTFAITGKQG